MSHPADMRSYWQKNRDEIVIYVSAVLVSLLAHTLLIEGLGHAARNRPKRKPRIVEMALVQPPPPPIEVEPEPPPPPKKIDLKKVKKQKPPDAPPPPNTSESKTPPKEATPVFGISMSSVVGPSKGSGFSVRVGNTLMKDPEDEFTPPDEVQGYKPVPLHKVNEMPRPQAGGCPKGAYPPQARALAIEGKVRLAVDVGADGVVGDVQVLAGLGYGLDESAVEAMKRCQFTPARLKGEAVATQIQYTYTFLLDE